MNLGTGGQMSVSASRFIRATGLDTRPLITGRWLLVGASVCDGRAYQILERFFRQIMEETAGIKISRPLFDAMNRLASKADVSCGGINARTLFAGSRLAPEKRGIFEGLTAENMTPANLTRAAICGMTRELVEFYNLAKSAGVEVRRLAGAGNGVRRNPVVRAELEAQLKMPLHLPPYCEEAAVGAALVGGKSIGLFKNWEEVGRILFTLKRDKSLAQKLRLFNLSFPRKRESIRRGGRNVLIRKPKRR